MNRLLRALQGLVRPETAVLEEQIRQAQLFEVIYRNPTAATTTVAIAELSMGSVKMKARLVEAVFIPDAAITAGATHYTSLLVAKRAAASPSTSTNLITYAADTTTTDDAAQWDEKDLSAYFTATLADLDVVDGDTLTFAATKTGTNGMTFPAGTVVLRFRPRD